MFSKLLASSFEAKIEYGGLSRKISQHIDVTKRLSLHRVLRIAYREDLQAWTPLW
jgi:hypothetical protein